MSRLITFGCSLTQGQALEKDIAYSKLAWPYRLAEKMNLECVNMGENGASAKKIWYNIINFNFEPDDTVIILWTHMDRWCIFLDLEDRKYHKKTIANGFDIYPEIKEEYYKNIEQGDKEFKTKKMTPAQYNEDNYWMRTWYENFHTEYDMDLNYYLHVNHANTWLKSRVKTVFHLKASELNRVAEFNETEFLTTSINKIRENYPKALDNHHPGPEAMEAFASEVYSEIKTKLNN